tara:strand:- start:2 stop:1444 length:1443 start_codon:yes stop_codon:yes gene_type:complete
MSQKIKFIRNNEIIEINIIDSNETLLNYIRTKLKKTGTKEGCAEGGCGACTVVLGELRQNQITYKAVNSCIMLLPSLHGKQLILIEDLLYKNKLHPIQKSMVKFHGSQCGFCTPGFVMSLFAMFKNHDNYDDQIINDSIAGNLCRCTGYKPIINAAKSLNGVMKLDHFSENNQKTIKLFKLMKKSENFLISENNDKKFFLPTKINQLKKIIKNNPNSEIICGGTDVSLKITKELKTLKSIISISSIKELNFFKINKNFIEIGSSTPLIDFQEIIKEYYNDFYEILLRYGSVQIRNVATIGGNIATASPIGDTLPLLLSLNAKIIIESINNKKTVPLNKFFISYRKTILKKDEFIRSIIIPISNKNIFKAYKISKRIDDDISSVCASFNIEIKNNKINSVFIAYGGMDEIPRRAINCEKSLKNKTLSGDLINLAMKKLEKDYNPITDTRSSSDYRMKIAKNLLMKCFLEIINNNNYRINEY